MRQVLFLFLLISALASVSVKAGEIELRQHKAHAIISLKKGPCSSSKKKIKEKIELGSMLVMHGEILDAKSALAQARELAEGAQCRKGLDRFITGWGK